MEVWRLRSLVGDLVRRPAGALLHLLLAPGCGGLAPTARRPIRPICPIGPTAPPGAPAPPIGTSQTCRGCRANFALPGSKGQRPLPPLPPTHLPIPILQSANQPNGGVWGDAPPQSNQPISQSALRLSLRRRSLWFRRRRRGVLAGLDVIGHLLQACRTRTQTRRTLSGRQRRGRRPTLTHRPRPLTPLTPIRTMPRRQRPRHARPIGTLRRRGTNHRALNGPRHARPIRARLRHRDTPASTRMPRTRATRAVETRRPVGKDPSDQEEGCNQQCHSHGGAPFHTNSITPSPTPRNPAPGLTPSAQALPCETLRGPRPNPKGFDPNP